VPVKVKSAGILGGLRAFLPQSGADKRLLEAVYHYGASPKGGLFLYLFPGLGIYL
jgi:hypothetical protein